MSETTPEIAAIIDSLADLCCGALLGDVQPIEERAKPLLESLKLNGYSRKTHPPLNTEIENLALEKCSEKAIHRRAELMGIINTVQHMFNDISRWEVRKPDSDSGTRPANISSATDH